MKHIPRLLPLLVLFLCGATIVLPGTEKEIPLSEVPEGVLAAAQDTMPGIELTGADVEKTLKGLVYELEGTVDGKEFEIVISADGTVLKIDSEDNADDADDDEGDEDDEDDDDDDEDEDEDDKDEDDKEDED
ncbi:PepSY domain-containing protein [Candidatus Neomarinimicrobiota bacterium]